MTLICRAAGIALGFYSHNLPRYQNNISLRKQGFPKLSMCTRESASGLLGASSTLCFWVRWKAYICMGYHHQVAKKTNPKSLASTWILCHHHHKNDCYFVSRTFWLKSWDIDRKEDARFWRVHNISTSSAQRMAMLLFLPSDPCL